MFQEAKCVLEWVFHFLKCLPKWVLCYMHYYFSLNKFFTLHSWNLFRSHHHLSPWLCFECIIKGVEWFHSIFIICWFWRMSSISCVHPSNANCTTSHHPIVMCRTCTHNLQLYSTCIDVQTSSRTNLGQSICSYPYSMNTRVPKKWERFLVIKCWL